MGEIKRTVPKEILDDIVKNQPAYDSRVEALFLTEEEFKGLEDPNFDLPAFRAWKNLEGVDEELRMVYRNLIDILKTYVIMEEEYYPILGCWILGTYVHDKFETFPYIFLNAMKGSGKTRLLKLIAHLSKDGEVLASMKENH